MFETRIDDELRFRTLCEDDAEALFGVVDGNRAHLREWLYDHFVDHAMYALLKKDWNG